MIVNSRYFVDNNQYKPDDDDNV